MFLSTEHYDGYVQPWARGSCQTKLFDRHRDWQGHFSDWLQHFLHLTSCWPTWCDVTTCKAIAAFRMGKYKACQSQSCTHTAREGSAGILAFGPGDLTERKSPYGCTAQNTAIHLSHWTPAGAAVPPETLPEALQLLGSLPLLLQLHLVLPAKEGTCQALHVMMLLGSIQHCPAMPAVVQEGLPGLPAAALREVLVHHCCTSLQHGIGEHCACSLEHGGEHCTCRRQPYSLIAAACQRSACAPLLHVSAARQQMSTAHVGLKQTFL